LVGPNERRPKPVSFLESDTRNAQRAARTTEGIPGDLCFEQKGYRI
jgi:hypothetical protein